MNRTLSALAGMVACLTGCSSVKVDDYKDVKPTMDIREYFNGNIEATGIYIDYTGKADSYCHIGMKGSWNGNEGKLFERVTYDTGKTDAREWTMHVTDDHLIEGTAHDIVGKATGKQ